MRRQPKKKLKLFGVTLLLLALIFTCFIGCNYNVTDIQLSNMQLEFEYGEEFSSEGLVVTVTNLDGSERTAKKSEYKVDSSSYRADQAGDYTITVTFGMQKQSYVVTVKTNPADLWNEDGVLRILTIGNSFSDDAMEYVWQIADSLDVKVSLGNLYIGGCTIETHASNAKNNSSAYAYRTNKKGTWNTVFNYNLSDAIKSQDWDYISLQQASGSSGMADTYGDLQYLIDYVNELKPEHTQLVWHMTWAYQQNSTHNEFYKYSKDQMTMYNAIVSTVNSKVLTTEIENVIPNGTAIQNARSSYLGDNLTRDGYHLKYDIGRYIAGVTLFAKLSGVSVAELEWAPYNVDENARNVAIESAMNALKSPFTVTQSTYAE